ncbi:HEPN domain-containing protein [Protaetiibacter mangrovi]|uniref:HEPN domain-containing protein n=1 Tax=Protaetiibacter mangrovi TaxID=2970926 RepID=A0ABT1ZII2_9MICO|nr:HEPN domain-containing protein [Protaetiibacter mangrovi]MCS0500524.1 HEPN domain-containing protein [Protaetiibacter mangrovi]
MVAALIALEGRYPDPPPLVDRSTVEGLRGGAVVLMVGAFEHYLKQAIAESLQSLNVASPPIVFAKLPIELQVQAVYTGLDAAMKAKSWDPVKEHSQRLPGVLAAVERVHRGEILSTEIAETGGNPNPAQVKAIFKTVAYPAVFTNIKAAFDREWGQPTASTFVVDTLEAVVGRRHAVAHTASILNTSRADLVQWHKFLNVLVSVLDDALGRHMARLTSKAR